MIITYIKMQKQKRVKKARRPGAKLADRLSPKELKLVKKSMDLSKGYGKNVYAIVYDPD